MPKVESRNSSPCCFRRLTINVPFPSGNPFPQKITELPVAKPAAFPYTYRYSVSGFCHEISVQTHAELIAFVNWLHGDQKTPLVAIEPDRPQVF